MKKLIIVMLVLTSCAKDKIVEPFVCDSNNTISFKNQILPIIEGNCTECHGAGAGESPEFFDYATISSNASTILSAVKWEGVQMPKDKAKLNDSLINQISCWIEQGKLDN